MGYCMSQKSSKLFIGVENIPAVQMTINSLMTRGSGEADGNFRWVNTEKVLNAASLNAQFKEWGWAPTLDLQGNIVDLVFESEKLGDELKLFKAVAPYVKAGSFIDMYGEEGDMWRWHFDGADCQELEAQVGFAAPAGDIIDGDVREVPTRPMLTNR